MSVDIEGLSEAELIDLNHRIVARLRLLQQVSTQQRMLTFSPGEGVWFQPEGRPRVQGVVVRYNKKTIAVVTAAGEHWNVTPGALHKVKDGNDKTAKAGDAGKRPGSSNVIPLRRK